MPGETNSTVIKPLTKRKLETGEIYTRRPETELQIGKILTLEAAQILEFLKNTGRDSADYLLDETIVYLLRDSSLETNFQETLYAELNRRLWKLLKKFYKRFDNPADFEDFGQKVEFAILKKIFDLSTDSADYAQVNFGDFAVKTAKVTCRVELVKINRENELFDHGRKKTDDSGFDEIDNKFAADDALTDYTLMLKEGLAKLPPNTMLVAELMIDGWQIESKDPSEMTISRKLGVSSRTIRNWLTEARILLADYNREIKK